MISRPETSCPTREDIVGSGSTSDWEETLILAAIEPSIGYQKFKQDFFDDDLGSQHGDGGLLGRLLLVFDRLSGLGSLVCSGVGLVLCKTL